MPRRNLLVIGLIAACLLGAVGLGVIMVKTGALQDQGQPSVGGPFQLVNQDGKPTDEKILNGKWTAVFFGFTYCPDVCPTTMQAMALAQDQLGPKAKDFQVVFVSIDPARDTPAQLKTYLSNEAFPKGIIGLTGTDAQVAAAAKAYRAYYAKSGDGPDYLMNHFSGAYLMDPKGRFDRILPYGISPEELTNQISAAMRG